VYVTATALRLARFNVLSHGKPTPGWFTGLPSPAAGMTLATYFAFSQTTWYKATIAYLDLQHQELVVLLLLLSVLMVSKVMYPRGAPVSLRTPGGIVMLAILVGLLAGALIAPSWILFPFFLAYITFGVLRRVVLILLEHGGPE
jgi:CDP-diacylglycerol--serine O-phosphatidyltransferase